jgi:hypothetical protein
VLVVTAGLANWGRQCGDPGGQRRWWRSRRWRGGAEIGVPGAEGTLGAAASGGAVVHTGVRALAVGVPIINTQATLAGRLGGHGGDEGGDGQAGSCDDGAGHH